MSPERVAALLADLDDEQRALLTLLNRRSESEWDRDTPAPGWSVRHQVAHLAYFDGAAVTAATRPDEFANLRAEADSNPGGFGERVLLPFLTLSAHDLLDAWRDGHDLLGTALRGVAPDVRLPWFGPSMSLASMVTARLMETWAHGQDIADALAFERPPSRRLEHIARMACLARPYSYSVHGLPLPQAAIRVSLMGPTGAVWEFGEADAVQTVQGPLLDFCLVLTRRRHVADTALTAIGDAAAEWLPIGQAYAGDPGEGRQIGQFAPV